MMSLSCEVPYLKFDYIDVNVDVNGLMTLQGHYFKLKVTVQSGDIVEHSPDRHKLLTAAYETTKASYKPTSKKDGSIDLDTISDLTSRVHICMYVHTTCDEVFPTLMRKRSLQKNLVRKVQTNLSNRVWQSIK